MNGEVHTINQASNRSLKKVSLSFFILSIFTLFLYSFTQIDLNLTLSSITFTFAIQDFFQNIGYFHRPLSTFFYLCILILLFCFYIYFFYQSRKQWTNVKQFWAVTLAITFLLLFSYPAFSYDVFNYIFDARIITKYQENPYFHKALDYPSDPWINFMRWTHRLYPYGPLWLVLTVPLSFIGFGNFLPTLYLFKALIAASYLGIIYFLQKILELNDLKNKLLFLVFFAFNPLVIIESLVSSHNDTAMMFLSVAAVYFLFRKKYFPSFVFLLLSGAIKFATFVLIPLFLLKIILDKSNKKINLDKFAMYAILLMLIAIIGATIRTQFQPWYLLYILPFAALLADKKYISIPLIILSLGALLLYVPFIYLGNWNPPVPTILNLILTFSIVVALSTVFVTIKLPVKFLKK